MDKLLALCSSILYFQFGLVTPRSLEIYGKGVLVQKPYIPLTTEQFTENYKKFATNLVKDADFTDEDEGVTFGTFSVGHALAVLHEQVILNISLQGFSSVLETPELQIRNSYRDILEILAQDPNVNITSTIYTQQDDVLLTIGLGKLKSKVNLVDPKKSPKEYIEFINTDLLVKNKFGVPVNAFPNKPGIPDGDYFATTFNYKNSWGSKWEKSKANHSFNSLFAARTVDYMETTGRFDYISNNDFEAVKIPFQGGQLSLVFVLSKTHVDLWQPSGKNVWEPLVTKLFQIKPSQWTSKMINLKVPVFEYLYGTSYFSQLKKLGITQAMCLPSAPGGGNSLEQIAQISKVKFGLDEFSISTITGTKDNISGKPNKLKSNRHTRAVDQDEDELPVWPSNNNGSHRDIRQSENDSNSKPESMMLDQPYFWSLEDEQIGTLALGAILLPVHRFAKLSENYIENYLECNKAH